MQVLKQYKNEIVFRGSELRRLLRWRWELPVKRAGLAQFHRAEYFLVPFEP